MPYDQSKNLSRRSVITRGALGIAGIAAGSSAVAAPTTPAAPKPKHADAIKASEYWVTDGETKLFVYRKRLVGPAADKKVQHVLFLAHGSSVSGVPSFDLQIPGKGEFSMMDVFARWGFDVWTMDFEGYGKSSRTGGNSNLDRSFKNMQAVVKFIQDETKHGKFNFFGESAGALRVGLYAQRVPEQVNRLGLASLSYTGEGSPTLAKRKEGLPFLSTHDRRPRDREMIRSIFTRDKDGTYDPVVPDALANAELKLAGSDSVPTGSYVDMTTKLPVLDPQKAVTPFILLRGVDDGIATEKDVLNYFSNATTTDREYRLIPGATHAVGWGNQRETAWEALRSFLLTPAS